MATVTRLTTYSHGAGCACKLGPGHLAEVLGRLDGREPPGELVVGPETRDDAAVYRLPDGAGLVQSVDFFTPIVDDAEDWGRIAAANAMSDIYAMGARPAIALDLVAWPAEDLPMDLLARVLEGGRRMAAEAGVAVVGGHSIDDREPKYGMAVTGFVNLDRVVRNSTAPAHARLFLTKPLGLGIISTAIKRERASEAQVAAAVRVMTTLNAAASDAMVDVGADAATDVTGFGLLGHLHEMLEASGVGAELDVDAVPFLDGTLDLAAEGVIPSGTRRNHRYVDPHVDWGDLPDHRRLALADAQTSGGLLIAVSRERGGALATALATRGVEAAEIGVTVPGQPGTIAILRS
jgi:selenide, water dikinase